MDKSTGYQMVGTLCPALNSLVICCCMSLFLLNLLHFLVHSSSMESPRPSVSAPCSTTGLGMTNTHQACVHSIVCAQYHFCSQLQRVLKPVTQNSLPKNVQRFETVEVNGRMTKRPTKVCEQLVVFEW